jgi:hypothetical protein
MRRVLSIPMALDSAVSVQAVIVGVNWSSILL